MKKEIIYSLKGIYREDYQIEGYRFGGGEKSACIVGALRGNEIQQLYICSQLVKALKELEAHGAISHNHEILVIPSVNRWDNKNLMIVRYCTMSLKLFKSLNKLRTYIQLLYLITS